MLGKKKKDSEEPTFVRSEEATVTIPSPPPDAEKRFCVDIDLVYGEDFTLRYSAEPEATAAVQGFFTDGYVSRDVTRVASHKYDTLIYPLEQVRVIRIWEDES